MFICIVGMDGSGKTTLAHNTLARVQEHQPDARYVYGRFQPILARPIMAVLRPVLLRGRRGPTNHSDYEVRRKSLFANHLLYGGYQVILVIDYLLQVAWRIGVPRMRGRTLICDRYYIDTVSADIAIDARDPEKTLLRTLRFYRRLLPRPDVMCLTDVPAEVAYARKNDIPSLDYARRLRELYLEAAEQDDIIVLDGTMSPHELTEQVLSVAGLSVDTRRNPHSRTEKDNG